MNPTKLTVWKCRDCGETYEKRNHAVECCDEDKWKKTEQRKQAKMKQHRNKARVRVTEKHVRANCPYKRCGTECRIKIRTTDSWGKVLHTSRTKRIGQAEALLQAQLSRHLNSYH